MKSYTRAGFSSLLILLIIAAVAGTGAVVISQNTNSPAVETVQEKITDAVATIKQVATSSLTTTDDESVAGEEQQVLQDDILEQQAAKANLADSGQREVITLAGGCFWCMEAFYQEAIGVIDAVSGYAGGNEESASYLLVSKGNTQHREAVQITYDPVRFSTADIIDFFWTQINPTDTGGQFADRGFQYTTAIYYHTEEQRQLAEASKQRLANSGLFDGEIVTEILPYSTFFEAEEYHQDYYKKAADHYNRYKKASGRSGFIEENWAKDAAIEFLQNQEVEEVSVAPVVQPRGDYNYTDEEIAYLLENLDPLAYHVVAEDGTESPFNNAYWDNKADGIYVDVITGEPLFSSTHKYDSGTGWPSFWRGIDEENIILNEDNSLSQTRTEVSTETTHLGHVFDDGPVEQGGRRFCINSASLDFVPKVEMEARGYGEYLYLFEE